MHKISQHRSIKCQSNFLHSVHDATKEKKIGTKNLELAIKSMLYLPAGCIVASNISELSLDDDNVGGSFLSRLFPSRSFSHPEFSIFSLYTYLHPRCPLTSSPPAHASLTIHSPRMHSTGISRNSVEIRVISNFSVRTILRGPSPLGARQHNGARRAAL